MKKSEELRKRYEKKWCASFYPSIEASQKADLDALIAAVREETAHAVFKAMNAQGYQTPYWDDLKEDVEKAARAPVTVKG